MNLRPVAGDLDPRPKARPIIDLTRNHKGRLAALAATSFSGAGLEAAFLVVLTSALLNVTRGAETMTFPILGLRIENRTAFLLSAIAIFARLLFAIAGVRQSAALTARVTADNREQLAHAYLNTSWPVQQGEPSGRLQDLLTSFAARISAAMNALSQGVTAGLSLLAFLAMGLAVDALSTLASIAGLGLLAGVLAPIRKRARSFSIEAANANLTYASAVAELGALTQEMQVFGVRPQFERRLTAINSRVANATRHVQVFTSALSPVYTSLAYIAILAGVIAIDMTDFDSLTSVGSVLLLMLRSLSYGQQLVSVSGQLSASRPFLEKLESTIGEYRRHPAPRGTERPGKVTPIIAEEITYAYSSGEPALNSISFDLGEGELIGIIGPSGSGKSTLAQIVLGLRSPDGGQLTVAGVPFSGVDREWWTERVAFVPQEPLLLSATVAENIRFLRDAIIDEDIWKAVRLANFAADVESLPDGLDTVLGPGKRSLSGGQKQRLAIARALVGNPELLVLDEPTSALDSESERLITATLNSLRGVTTTIIIAHRMTTVEQCDRIIALKRGRIEHFLTPLELRRANAFYRNALLQARGKDEDIRE